ncbi:DNA-methyltransferase [Uliginosibacterium gangwonense]|uniref:DNA-methyltransferase n=1 Tax=Uliginosibacterium gangwonense TaxID=392736 RepID=UPI00037A2853|nr:site-specific DNA-methyltransferase [Uliginosibacterium gangwonense]
MKKQTQSMPLNTLQQGDCLKFLAALPDHSADALITDPPYSSGGLHISAKQAVTSKKYLGSNGASYPEFLGDHRDQRSHLHWSLLWLSECYRVLKPGAPVCLFSDWRQLPTTTDALQGAGFLWRGITVWDKTEGVRPQPGRFRQQAEYVVWGSKGDMPLQRGVGVLPGVYRVSIKAADKHHTTGKPTELMRSLVKICQPGGVILDPFAGSGTTLVAAAQEGYQWLGCELSAEYAQVARQRLAA